MIRQLRLTSLLLTFVKLLVCIDEINYDDDFSDIFDDLMSDDGIEVKIIKKIADERCKIRSELGDIVEHFFKLTNKNGEVLGSNFGDSPHKFVLGNGEVVRGIEKRMIDMCEGEQRMIKIPLEVARSDGFIIGGITPESDLNYLIELYSIKRPTTGERWIDDDGIQIRIIHKIEDNLCKKAATGDVLNIHYTLFLEDGTFIESTPNYSPMNFVLGYDKQMVPGLQKALHGMCEGEKRKIDIPPALAYGEDGKPPLIPGNLYLNYDVDLLKVTRKDEL